MTRRRSITLAAAVLAAALGGLARPPALAMEQLPHGLSPGGVAGRAPDITGRVDLVSQTPWVQGDQPLQLRLRLGTSGPVDQLEVAVTLYRRVANRTEFGQTLEGRLRSSGFDQTRVPLTELTADEEGTVGLTVTPALSRAGVYPVRVELREKRGGPVLDSFMTHLVYLPGPVVGELLKLAWVVPVHAPPAIQPDGSTRLEPAVADGLSVLGEALVTHAPLVTLRPTPETLEALAASPRELDRATLADLVRAGRASQLVGGHFVPTNLPVLLAAGLDGEVAAQLSEGVASIARAFATTPDDSTWVADDRVDGITLDQLAAQQYDRLVVPEASLVPTDLPTTLTQPFELESEERRLRATSADAGLAAHMGESDDPVLAAHHLLADLAVVYFDHPGRPGGVVLAPPRTWRPMAAFLDAFLGGLAASPIVASSTLEGLFDAVPPAAAGGTRLVRRVAPAPPGATGMAAGPIRSARRELDSFATLLEPGNPLPERISRRLLVSQSVDLSPQTRAAYLEGARAEIAAQLEMIEIPPNRSITLTARNGEIPVTITSRAAYPVRAVLRVRSPTLEFPSGDRWPLQLNRRNTTERIPVHARASGSFPLRVRLESPDGSLVLAESVFSVRSTAGSGVGLVISAGAALFLLVWWGRHLRGRRSQKLVPA